MEAASEFYGAYIFVFYAKHKINIIRTPFPIATDTGALEFFFFFLLFFSLFFEVQRVSLQSSN
jgi:hypothetical protein